MDKKAEIRTQMIIAIIAVVVLAVVLLFWFNKGGSLNKYFSFLPGFDDTKEKASEAEIRYVRYNIPSAQAQYYDGVAWINIPSVEKIEFQDMTLIGKSLRESFVYFFSDPEGRVEVKASVISSVASSIQKLITVKHGNIEVGNFGGFIISWGPISLFSQKKLTQIVWDEYPIYAKGAVVKAWMSTKWDEFWGDAEFLNMAGDYWFEVSAGDTDVGVFVLNPLEGKLYFIENQKQSEELMKKSREQADVTGNAADVKSWILDNMIYPRDRIIMKKTVSLKILNGGTKEEYFCVDDMDSWSSLVIDLQNPVAAGKDCSGYNIIV